MADVRLPELRRFWEEARRRGVELSPEQLCRNCPELTDQVRELIAVWDTHSSQHGGTWGVVADGPVSPAPAAAPPVPLAAGTEPVAGYRLDAFLGKGAFGEVWRATGPGDVPMALKFIPLQSAAGEGRALELMKRQRHPHLLALFGVWQQDGRLIIASELADGTLADRLAQCRDEGLPGIPAAELLEYMRDAARAIDFLNEPRSGPDGRKSGGIQHRDIKPANLLLVGGSVKVADFGLAKLLEKTIATASHAMTPAYAAPEFFNEQASRWSDQYSLAVTYCQLRTGELPFGGNFAAVMHGHLLGQADLSKLPAGEQAAVARALAKKPEERWPSCAAFVEALASGATRRKQAPQAAPAKVQNARHAQPRTAPAQQARPAQAPSQSFWPMATVAATLLASVLLALLLWQFSRAPTNDSSKAPEPRAKADIKPPDGKESPPPKKKTGVEPAKKQQPEPPPVVKEPKKEAPPKDPPAKEKDPPVKVVKLTPPLPDKFENSIGMKLKLIPKGKFLMGSPATEEGRTDVDHQHEVEITQPFYMGIYEVTQAQYQKVMGENPSYFSAEGGGKDTVAGKDTSAFPVENVSWEDAVKFCKRLSELPQEQKSVRVCRLPTEAEWEYACRGRADSSTPFHFGKSLSSTQANFNGKFPYGGAPEGPYLVRTEKVGSYPANSFGLYDMHGNVWEWCADWYDKDYYGNSPSKDPQGPESSPGKYRVLRGGSWYVNGVSCRSAQRYLGDPGFRSLGYNGFRVFCRPGERTP